MSPGASPPRSLDGLEGADIRGPSRANVAELADAPDSGSGGVTPVRVQVPPFAQAVPGAGRRFGHRASRTRIRNAGAIRRAPGISILDRHGELDPPAPRPRARVAGSKAPRCNLGVPGFDARALPRVLRRDGHARARRNRRSRGDAPAHVEIWRRLPQGGAVACIVADDRPGLLSLISASLVAQSLDIVSAQAYTRALTATAGRRPWTSSGCGATPNTRCRSAPPTRRRWPALLGGLITGKRSLESVMRRARPRDSLAPGATTRVTFNETANQGVSVLTVRDLRPPRPPSRDHARALQRPRSDRRLRGGDDGQPRHRPLHDRRARRRSHPAQPARRRADRRAGCDRHAFARAGLGAPPEGRT